MAQKNIVKTIIIIILGISISASIVYGVGYITQKKSTESKDEKVFVRTIPVVLTKVTKQNFEEVVKVHGNLKARNFALVSPRIPGVLEEVFVREGDEAIAGKTKLFQTDSLKLAKAVEMCLQELNVKKCTREEKEANLEKTEAEFRKAEREYKRSKDLYDRRATSQNEYEEKWSNYEQFLAMCKHANSLLNLAKEDERKDKAALDMAEKDLQDSLVLAPINGKVSKRMAEPGEIGSPGVPVVRIDDIKILEAYAYLPSRYYPLIHLNKTRVRMQIHGQVCGEYPVSYKSPTVDPTLRTFEIKCDVSGDGERLIPGALVDMTVILTQRVGKGIPWESIQERNDKKMVFTISDDIAYSVPIETGIETGGWMEIISGNISENSFVVSRGQFLLNNGSPVKVQKGDE